MLRSPEVAEGGMLPKEFTGDGSSATLPLEWSGAPAGTRSFAVIMHHLAPGRHQMVLGALQHSGRRDQSSEERQGDRNAGQQQCQRKLGYAPPHSKGPGPKKYTYTVYALSAAPQITAPPEEVSRDVLLAAMKDSILATAELNVIYSRGERRTKARPRPPRDQEDATASRG